jgi:hypothetical protein
MKFLTLLLGILDKLLGRLGGKQTLEAARASGNHQGNERCHQWQIALGEAAIVTPDPERTERLRDRFDRSRK